MRSRLKGWMYCCMAIIVLAGMTASAFAAPFTDGSLVVVRFGDGSGALTNAAWPTFLEEYTVGGALLQTLPLPTTDVPPNKQLTNTGNSGAEGFLTLSVDGRYLTLAGYDADVGTLNLPGTTSVNNPRVIGRVAMSGTIDTTTALTDAYSVGNIRSAVSTDGTVFWASGSNQGVRYVAALGNTTSTQLNTVAPTNLRVVNIYSSQLYTSSASGTFQGVSTVGTGLPTTSPQTITLLPGFPTAAGPSTYDYWFKNANTLYVADDRLAASGGGIQKWLLSGGTWTLTYTLNVNLTAGCRGLAGTVVGGNAVLYATTADAAPNSKLVTVTDVGAGSPFTVVTTAAANTVFHGVELIATGACCTGETCTITTQANCTGEWRGTGTVCSPNPCTFPTGACCNLGTWGCEITTQANCTGVGFAWHGEWSSCSPNLCPVPPTGACCSETAPCVINYQAQCLAPAVWTAESEGGTCSTCLIKGACCVGGVCTAETKVDCGTLGGTYYGDYRPCDGGCPATPSTVVISQVYGGSGCALADCSLFKNDYVELFNRGATPVDISGWSVQYGSAAGSFSSKVDIPASTSIPAGGYYLIKGTETATGTNPVDCYDIFQSGQLVMSATTGKVALVKNTTLLPNCPNSNIADLVGYGAANAYENNPAPVPNGTSEALFRAAAGCTDTDDNSADLTSVYPAAPRCSTTTPNPCMPLTGACCQLDGTCTATTQALCTGGAIWQGVGTTCVPNLCPTYCATCRGDVFGNNVLNGADVQAFVNCVILGGPVAQACACADINMDGFVNLTDVNLFVNKLIAATGTPPCPPP